jgi:hypothetical protein
LVILNSTALLGYFIAKKILKLSIDRLILPIFLATTLFFGYTDIVEKIIKPHNVFPIIKASYIYLTIFFATIYFSWKISAKPNLQKAAKVLICTVFALSLFSLTIKYFHQTSGSKTISLNNETSFQFKHKPDVYYILVDAYARQDTLKEVANYNNEPFLKQLAKNGFIISKSAKANYHFTNTSLSATMSMEYHTEDKNSTIATKPMLTLLKGVNKVRKIFKQNGYYIINIPAHWHKTSCHGNEDLCIIKHSLEVYRTFLMTTPLKILKFPHYYVDLDAINATYNTITNKSKFIFIHIAQIHDCVSSPSGKFDPAIHPATKTNYPQAIKSYISAIKMTNPKIIDFIDRIKRNDPNSIIIIQADHGPGLTAYINDTQTHLGNQMQLQNKNDFRYRFGIFSAIYLPNYNQKNYQEIKKYFAGPYTLVNTFRYIFAYLSDKKPDLLPERSYFLYEDRSCAPVYKQDNIEHLEN